MSRRITRGGLLVILAFLVPVIVELRTIAGLLGFALSATQYLAVAAALVLAVLGGVGLWNLRVGDEETNAEGA
ncbi:hypothetical protein [Natronomonas amylolytica]|uniref:hypothetical protein n=1 Tax=Natronomonas amylolytica TaxID=3108498 RepID=UPI00300A6370